MIHTSLGWVHALDPFLIQFTDTFGIRWYGLSYLLGFVISYLLARVVMAKRGWENPSTLAGDFVFAAALATIIGGRLAYCFIYDRSLLFQFSGDFPFWGVLMVHHGGMASHGGILAIVLTCFWFARSRSVSVWPLMDIVAMAGCVGIFFGRVANFINGELVGRPASSNALFSVRFPQDLFSLPRASPELLSLTPVMERLGVTPDQWGTIASRGGMHLQQSLQTLMQRLHGGDQQLAETLAPFLIPRHPSQLYASALEGLAVGLCALFAWKRASFPGAAAIVFLLGYPVARFLGEQYRMPDAQIGFDWLGLTRGQWLSVLMFALASLLFVARRRSIVQGHGTRLIEPKKGDAPL